MGDTASRLRRWPRSLAVSGGDPSGSRDRSANLNWEAARWRLLSSGLRFACWYRGPKRLIWRMILSENRCRLCANAVLRAGVARADRFFAQRSLRSRSGLLPVDSAWRYLRLIRAGGETRRA